MFHNVPIHLFQFIHRCPAFVAIVSRMIYLFVLVQRDNFYIGIFLVSRHFTKLFVSVFMLIYVQFVEWNYMFFKLYVAACYY